MFARFMAKQFGNPSGLFGRLFLAPVWNRRNRAPNDCAFENLDLRPDDRVLEVGFGGGYLMERMSAAVADGFIAGVDHSPTMISFCAGRFRSLIHTRKMELKLSSSDALPFPDAAFNKACSVNSIFYWQDAPKVFSEFYRVLRVGGKLVIVFTRRESLQGKKFSRHGLRLYTPYEVHRMMSAAGFRDIEEHLLSDWMREFWCVKAIRNQPAFTSK